MLLAAAEEALAELAAQRAAIAAAAATAAAPASTSATVGGTSDGGDVCAAEAALVAALFSLRCGLGGYGARDFEEPAKLLESLQKAMEPAGRIATLLLQLWDTRASKEAARLAWAKAAAARSCAFLRCAELGGVASQGPAAGQRGSKRCTACCAVRYCGEKCSHVDWRAGGHRKVCKALAAAREAAASE